MDGIFSKKFVPTHFIRRKKKHSKKKKKIGIKKQINATWQSFQSFIQIVLAVQQTRNVVYPTIMPLFN